MKVKKYTIQPTSTWITPLRSDTLHGLFACQVREWEGEQACKDFLASFEAKAPFTCSSAFPTGFLPFPCLTPIQRQRFSSLFAQDRAGLIKALKKYKEFKKTSFIPYSVYEQYKNNLSLENLFSAYCDDSSKWEKPKIYSQVEQHNTANRLTNTVDSGLFSQTIHAYEGNLDIYIEAENHDFIAKYIDRIGEVGFGSDSTLGKGRFKVLHELTADMSEVFQAKGEYNFSLSVFSSEDLSSLDGYYKLFTKKGRTWVGMSAISPFKKSFLALEEGAMLKSLPLGGILKNIHKNKDIVQLCHALTLPCSLAENGGQ